MMFKARELDKVRKKKEKRFYREEAMVKIKE